MEEAYNKKYDTDLKIHPEAEIHPECSIEKTRSQRKNALLAALLFLIISGLGQVYAGDLLRGLALLVGLGLAYV